jgi:hypothetical protein
MNKQQKESSPKTNDATSSQDTHSTELTPEVIKCKKILEADKSIRYAGICTSDGTLVASEYKKEITPLINGAELDFAVKLSAIRAMERNILSDKLGSPMYSIASYENVKRATISLDKGMFLLVSFERNADDALIINKVMNEMNINYTLSLCELSSRLAQSLQDPLSVIKSLVEISRKRHHNTMNREISDNLDTIERIALKLSHQIHGVQAMNYHGTINIRAMDKDGHNIIEIEDTGNGIPENMMDKIFEPLFTTKEYGTGLGLKTCKNIIEQHKGKITFRNNPTTFTIMIPK